MINKIRDFYQEHQYRWFDDKKPYNVNIIGYRTKNTKPYAFDDFLYLIYRDNHLNWVIKQYAVTTDPGQYYLKNPINVNGTAILVPGQYIGAYKVGLHRNEYQSLVQAEKVKVYRDSNRDEILDFDPKTVDEGYFGINIHRAKKSGTTESIGLWSAGCTVFSKNYEFNQFMSIINKSKKLYGNRFTYTLIEESWKI